MVDCLVCGRRVQAEEACPNEVCRACHKYLTLEECVASIAEPYGGSSAEDLLKRSASP